MANTENFLHQRLHPQLSAALERNQAGHAYLLRGEQALSQGILLAMALNCPDAEAGQPCKICSVCRRIAAGTFEDMLHLLPEKGWLRIEQIRNMQAKAGYEALAGGYKIILIQEAELLREEAANSLLKILEEPPAQTVFILTTTYGEGLLPTIVSRCSSFYLGEEAALPLDEERLLQARPAAEEFLQALPQAGCFYILNTAKGYEKDKEALLYFFLALWQNLYQQARGEKTSAFPQEKAVTAALFVERAIDLIRKNINLRLLADVVLLRLWRMAYIPPQNRDE